MNMMPKPDAHRSADHCDDGPSVEDCMQVVGRLTHAQKLQILLLAHELRRNGESAGNPVAY